VKLARLRAALGSAMGLCVRARSIIASIHDPKPRRKLDGEKEPEVDRVTRDYSIWDVANHYAPPLEENGQNENAPEDASGEVMRQKIAEDARRLRWVIEDSGETQSHLAGRLLSGRSQVTHSQRDKT
jgi:hypothetical protein